MLRFDFDIAADGYDKDVLDEIATRHGVAIEKVNKVGPGGGNPQVFALAASREDAKRFLQEVYVSNDPMDYILGFSRNS